MNKYLNFISKLNVPQSIKKTLEEGSIKSVTFDEINNLLLLMMTIEVAIDEDQLTTISLALAKLLGVNSVRFEIEKTEKISFAEFCSQPHEVLSDAGVEFPALVWRSLNAAAIEILSNRITIAVDNEAVEKLLHDNQTVELIKKFLAECTDHPAADCVEISIVVQELPEDSDIIEEDLRASEVEASSYSSPVSKTNGGSFGGNGAQLLGKPSNVEPKRILELIRDECFNVAIEGRIFKIETRKTASKATIILFSVVDDSEAINCKIFVRSSTKDDGSLADRIKKGMLVKIHGDIKRDQYDNRGGLVMEPKSITVLPAKPLRMDDCEHKRVEFHCHSKMSSLDATVSATDIVSTAARWGHRAVAITDHGVAQSFPDAARAAAKYNKSALDSGSEHRIKVIYGIEGYLVKDEAVDDVKAHLYHIIILAKNQTGLKNLYKLISDSHLLRYKKRPRVLRSDIEKYREGLIVGSACEAGEVFRAIATGENDSELKRIADFYDYLEIQPTANNSFMIRRGLVRNYEHLQLLNKQIVQLGEVLKKPVLATTDAHFLNPEDEIYRSIILAVKGMEDGSYPLPLYFRNTKEMLTEFSYLGEEKAFEVVVTNTNMIADSIEFLQPIPNKLFPPKIPGSEEEIQSMAIRNAKLQYGEILPAIVSERLDFELKSIVGHGYAVLYLIAHKLVKKSNEDGYLVGSRGSVGSSFVATMTGITEVNPLPPHWLCSKCKTSEFVLDGSFANGFDLPDKKCSCGAVMSKNGHNIPFAVFMGFEGDKTPDIDLNFSGEYQAKIHKYTEELLGKENVFRAGTISTVAEKNAYGFAKKYFETKGFNASEAYITSFSEGCVGVKRTSGQHPGGLMVVPYDMDICDVTPVQYPAEAKDTGIITTHFDYHSIHDALVKLDNLGHDVPTIIKDLSEMSDTDPNDVAFDDIRTLSLFSSTEAVGLTPEQLLGSTVATFGVPEFGTKFVREMLRDTNPKKFSELVRISGFSHGTDVWLGNAKDLIVSKTAKVGEVISARDDIMIYLIDKGLERKHAFTIMENVRKGKGLSAQDVEAMKAAKVPNWYIDSCQKIKYLFPKAHAVAYVMMAFRIAYFKVHEPLPFYAASFSVKAEDFDAEMICNGLERLKREYELLERKGKEVSGKEEVLMPIMELAIEMYLRGFEFMKVDLQRSHCNKFRIIDNKVLPPLCALSGLGGNAALNIVRERELRPFTSIEDLQTRARINKTVTEVMRTHGCFTGMEETDQMTLF
ncbi:MAG: PolC-type DNA polymerase III [Negativicutes bacterium]|jgi:DNA polymerase-3 subunit alpha (Gram-positive type)